MLWQILGQFLIYCVVGEYQYAELTDSRNIVAMSYELRNSPNTVIIPINDKDLFVLGYYFKHLVDIDDDSISLYEVSEMVYPIGMADL